MINPKTRQDPLWVWIFGIGFGFIWCLGFDYWDLSNAAMIRVVLPVHLRTLAKVDDEVKLEVAEPVTQRTILDALEAAYPVLRGTVRDKTTQRRRPLLYASSVAAKIFRTRHPMHRCPRPSQTAPNPSLSSGRWLAADWTCGSFEGTRFRASRICALAGPRAIALQTPLCRRAADIPDPKPPGYSPVANTAPARKRATQSPADSVRTHASPVCLSCPRTQPHPPAESRRARTPRDERTNHIESASGPAIAARAGAP